MGLYRTPNGYVSHADGVPIVKSVPSRRDAETAFVEVISKLPLEMVNRFDDHISMLRDFIWSR